MGGSTTVLIPVTFVNIMLLTLGGDIKPKLFIVFIFLLQSLVEFLVWAQKDPLRILSFTEVAFFEKI